MVCVPQERNLGLESLDNLPRSYGGKGRTTEMFRKKEEGMRCSSQGMGDWIHQGTVVRSRISGSVVWPPRFVAMNLM